MTSDFTATLPRKRMGAGLLFPDARGRVLLVEPTYKAYWEIPGGAVFDGGMLTAEQLAQIQLPADELRSWAWCPEQEAGERLSEVLARRIAAALRARAQGTSVYLENGFLVA